MSTKGLIMTNTVKDRSSYQSAWKRHLAKDCKPECIYCKSMSKPTITFKPIGKKIKMTRGQVKVVNAMLQKQLEKLHKDLMASEKKFTELTIKYEQAYNEGFKAAQFKDDHS